tara:strand:+ start:11809 stop:12543 length:735 start_codon:yes stop_codon:yes gene_type:complete
MAKLKNKVAVITGGTSGMAFATAKLFVKEGAYVFITGRRQEQLDIAVNEIGSNVMGIQADSGNLSDLENIFKIIKDKKGNIDILFVSAGIGDVAAPLGTISEKGYEEQFNVNVRGTLFTVQNALPLFSDGGSIILNGSIANAKGFPGSSVYSASKAAVRSFARTWANELKDRKIRVNTLSPGPIDTNVFTNVPEEIKNSIKMMIPMGRLGQPEEIASATLFLASSDSSFITGIDLAVDGGTAQI